MTEEIRYIANLQRQEEFDNEVTELKDELKRLEQENKELKEEIQFHNKENSNLLAKRNAAQIGYDEIREVRERYRSSLEEIRDMFLNQVAWVGQLTNFEEEIYNKINEVLK